MPILYHDHRSSSAKEGGLTRFRAPIHFRPSGPNLMTLPNFLIVGAPKSGTTALARYLGDHPSVFFAAEKELHFFDRHELSDVAWYEAHFADVGDERCIGEGTPRYMYIPEAVDRMAELLPDARLLVILRNPVDRAYSHYWHNRSRGNEKRSFDDAIRDEAEHAAGGGADDHAQVGYHYLDRGHYQPRLERVCARYPREQVHVSLFEDLRDDAQGTYSAVCRFLGVDDTFAPPALGKQINEHRTFRSLRLREFVAENRRLPKSVRNALGTFNTRSKGYPSTSLDARRRLDDLFPPEIEALGRWLGRDLDEWAAPG